MMETHLIQTKLEELKKEVFDYIDFLIMKQYKGGKKEKFTFDWAGGLSNLKEKYTLVELQHKAMEWR